MLFMSHSLFVPIPQHNGLVGDEEIQATANSAEFPAFTLNVTRMKY